MAIGEPSQAWRVFDRMERASFDLGRYGDMSDFYRELLDRSPKEAGVATMLALAEMHRRKGEFSDAENFLSDALELEPENLRAHRHRIKLSLDQGDVEEAQRRLDGLLSALDAEEPFSGSA